MRLPAQTTSGRMENTRQESAPCRAAQQSDLRDDDLHRLDTVTHKTAASIEVRRKRIWQERSSSATAGEFSLRWPTTQARLIFAMPISSSASLFLYDGDGRNPKLLPRTLGTLRFRFVAVLNAIIVVGLAHRSERFVVKSGQAESFF